MGKKRTINLLAGATILASLLWLFLPKYPPDIDHTLHQAVGQKLAEEALKLLEPNSRLIVIARAAQPYEVPAAEAQLEGFIAALHQKGKTISILRTLKLDPLRVAGVPPGDFFDLLRQSRDDDVIVSFLGPPALTEVQIAKLGDKRPRVLALCGLPVRNDLKMLFDQKLLIGAVVTRANAPARPISGPEQPFDQFFKLITLANVSELPTIATAQNGS